MRKLNTLLVVSMFLCMGFAQPQSSTQQVVCSPHSRHDIDQSVTWYRHSAEKNGMYIQVY